MIAAEKVQRQVAVVVVIAVEKAAFLAAMQRCVGGVQIDNDLRGRGGVRFQKQVYQQRVDRFAVVADLLIALGRCGIPRRALQPAQRALADQCRFRFALARQHAYQRIVSQLIVIVEVFVAQRQTVNTLRQHLHE